MGITINSLGGSSYSASVPSTPTGYHVDWSLPPAINVAYVKGTGLTLDRIVNVVIKDFALTHLPGTINMEWSYQHDDVNNPLVLGLSGDINFDTVYPLDLTMYGKYCILTLNMSNLHLMLPGVHTSEIKIVVKNASNTIVEEKVIPFTLTVYDAGTITLNVNPLSTNFCLDDLFCEVNSDIAKFVNVRYTILYKGETRVIESQFIIFHNYCKAPIGREIQPYIYLSEAEIDQFFELYKLDMKPALVDIRIALLDIDFQEIVYNEFLGVKFHAGRRKNIPSENSIIERSGSWNTFLPLVYEWPMANVLFKYRDQIKSFNKQQFSEPENIFQMMFIQKSHYADYSQMGGVFSGGFSGGFSTTQALLAANPLYLYEEAFVNSIHCYYDMNIVNFPWQVNSLNVFWMDENNNFHGLTFTGKKSKNSEFTHFVNNLPSDFSQTKAGSIKKAKIKLNTGWILASEINEVESLIRSNRVWIFGNDPQTRIEAVCITEKLEADDDDRELYDYTLDFEINEQ